MPSGERQRKPSRLLVAKPTRAARRGERFIAEYEFPTYSWKRVGKRLPRPHRCTGGGGCSGGGCGGGGS